MTRAIVVDIDNTILVNKERFNRCLKELGIKNIDEEKPEIVERFFRLFLSNKFLYLDKPIRGAKKAVEKLSKRYEIIYLTGRPYNMRSGTLKWLKENGFYFNKNLCFFKPSIRLSDAEFKIKMLRKLKKCFQIKAAIGDAPWDASVYRQHELKTIILYSGTYERKTYPPSVIFVKSWKEILEKLG